MPRFWCSPADVRSCLEKPLGGERYYTVVRCPSTLPCCPWPVPSVMTYREGEAKIPGFEGVGHVTVPPFTVRIDGQYFSLRLEEVITRYVLNGHSHTALSLPSQFRGQQACWTLSPDGPPAQSPPIHLPGHWRAMKLTGCPP